MTKNYYPTYFVTGASISRGVLSLTVNGTPSMSEHVHFALRFAPRVAIPAGVSSDTPVKLIIGGTSYDFKDKYAEPVVFAKLPKDRLNDSYFSPRFAIVGGVGSSIKEDETVYHYIAWDLPVL